MPEIKFDFSQVSYSGVLEVFAPITTGTVLAFGTLTLNPPLAASFLSNPFFGYKTRIVMGVLFFYLAGLLLNLMVSYVGYSIGYVFGYVFGQKLLPTRTTPWRNTHWRKTANTFLGEGLAPSTMEPYIEELERAELQKANQIQDPMKKEEQLKFINGFFLPKKIADSEWYWWHQVLEKYFTVQQWWAPPSQYYVNMLNMASWAIIVLMILNHRHHWFAWLFSITGISFGTLSSWFSGGTFSDPYAVSQTAMLLRIIKPGSTKPAS